LRMELGRISLNLMGLHANPSERVETEPVSNASAKDVWSGTKPVQYDFGIEQCALDGEGGNNYRFIATKGEQHVLLSTIDAAFNQHRPLALTPDDFFLPLVQAAALYIDEKLEQKQPVIGIQPGSEKVKLVVRRDDFALGQQNPWHEIFTTFGEMICKHTGDENYKMLRGEFTTTQLHQRAAYDVALMDACKSNFSYHNVFMCGIPQINLLGTHDDWSKLRVKASAICDLLGVKGWKEDLDKVLEKIEKCTDGHELSREELIFWCDLYRQGHHSGGNHITGWVNLFYPYIRRDKQCELANDSAYMTGKGWFGGRNVQSYTSSLSRAPVECNDRGKIVDLNYYAGQVGMKWDSTNKELSPAWGWCVTIRKSGV